MSHISVYIHFVWSTKYRVPYLNSYKLRQRVWKHMKENAMEKGIHIDFINGHNNHCHCLISLKPKQNMSDIMRLIKGESSFWINKNALCQGHFEWQDEYYAVSVSHSILPKVRRYINTQEAHHRDKSYEEEESILIKRYGLVKYQN